VVYVYDAAGAFTRSALGATDTPSTVSISLPPLYGQPVPEFVGDRSRALLSSDAVTAARQSQFAASVLLSRTAALSLVLQSTVVQPEAVLVCSATEPCGWEPKSCPTANGGQVCHAHAAFAHHHRFFTECGVYGKLCRSQPE
jgi:hypothetical protein